jgi:hypothetical protein
MKNILYIYPYLLLFNFCFTPIWATTGIITHIKGVATVLPPHTMQAKKLVLNDQIEEGSSIYTQNKSFLKIKLSDNSVLTISPNSKIIFQSLKLNRPNIISLIKGKLRSKIKKPKKTSSKSKIKLFIKTYTATMGVRGTEFSSTFNPKNNRTTLLTYQGEVLLSKKPILQKNLEKDISNQSIISVKRGEFSIQKKDHSAPSQPIKISPKQFTHLKMNSPFTKNPTPLEVKQELIKVKQEYAQDAKENKTVTSGTPGGLISLETGHYIPPNPDPQYYNKQLNIYEGTALIGSTTDDGNYIPPVGTRLDANQGFIIADKNSVNKKTIQKYNQTLKKEFPNQNKANPVQDSYKKYIDQ